VIFFAVGDAAGVGLATDDDVQAAGQFALAAQKIARAGKAEGHVTWSFRAFHRDELDLMWMAFALEIERNRTLLSSNRLAAGVVQNADNRFTLRMIDHEFGVILLIAQHDKPAAAGTRVSVARGFDCFDCVVSARVVIAVRVIMVTTGTALFTAMCTAYPQG
jgi:hypothetical protein